MYFYYTYGISIRSDIELTELAFENNLRKSNRSDVTLRYGQVQNFSFTPTDTNNDLGFWFTADKAIVTSKQAGKFLVTGGDKVVLDLAPTATQQIINTLIIDILLPIVLHQRGLLLLHASAISYGDGAIAFLGQSGAGKSTMAVAMQTYCGQSGSGTAASRTIFTDDMVVVDFDENGSPLVLPGISQIKLLPETVAAIDGLENKISTEVDFFTKKHICSEESYFTRKALPLKQIYLLHEGQEVLIEKIPPQKAFLELLRNCYAIALIRAAGSTTSQFNQYTQLARYASVYRLKRPRLFSMLPNLVRTIEKNASQQSDINSNVESICMAKPTH